MRITDAIRYYVSRRGRVIRDYGVSGAFDISREPFGDVVFRNIVEILTDLCNDVTWMAKQGTDVMKFAEFVKFFEEEGRSVLWRVFKNGYCVIGLFDDMHGSVIRTLRQDEYTSVDMHDYSVAKATIEGCEAVVVRSDIFATDGISDYASLSPFIKFLDDTLNASATMVKRLGALVIMTPETPSGSPTRVTLSDKDKEEMEKKIADEYGALSRQRQVMLLPRGMNTQVVSLVNIDARLNERVRLAVLAICDRVKVPANQVSIIDANSSKALSNGSELREGDFAKYQSFERLLNHTFVKMASDIGLSLTYSIYNKPQREAQS